MDNESLKQLIRITKNYYLLNLKMEDIAKREGISKASVSRIINKAKALGYVKVSLNLPSLRVKDLENKIQDVFGLKHVSVVETISSEQEVIYSQLADTLSQHLNEIVEDQSIIGVSWGNTMNSIAKHLQHGTKKDDIRVVQLNGGVSRRNVSSLSGEIMNHFTEKFDGLGFGLNTPSIVDNRDIASTLMEDSTIKETLNLAEAADIAIFSVGSISDKSILVQAGYFSEDDYTDLRKEGYVGDICSRYFKKDGTHEDGELYNRVIGLSLEKIQEKKHTIGIVVGPEKARGLLGALNGNYINSLFIDEETGLELLKLKNG